MFDHIIEYYFQMLAAAWLRGQTSDTAVSRLHYYLREV